MKITVVIPIYNCEQYIECLLKQLMEQSYKDFEVIMINDGSTDNSGEVCRKYQSQDNRFKYYEYSNMGVSSTRNKGVSIANGEYIIFFDADDKIDNDILYNLSVIANNTNADMIVFGYYMELLKDEIVKQRTIFKCNENALIHIEDSLIMYTLWEKSLMYNVWNRMIKTEIIKNNTLLFDTKLSMGEDLDFILDVLKYCKTLYVTDKVMYHYVRERQNSATSNKYIKNWFQIRTEEKIRLNKKFAELGYCSVQYKNFLDKRYIERVIGCIENEFKSNNIGIRDRYYIIKRMINNKETQKSLKNENIIFNSFFMRIIVRNMRKQRYIILYLIGFSSYFVRKYCSQLFIYLKNNR